MTRTIAAQQAAWASIPVDGAGYRPAGELLALDDDDLAGVVAGADRARYDGWRNHKGLWHTEMGTGQFHGRVLDYGCGLGVDAARYAAAGNQVTVADQNPATVELAARVAGLRGCHCAQALIDPHGPPYIHVPDGWFDLVVMNGVLHHIEDPAPVVAAAARWLVPGGELRVMVYTGRAWCWATGTHPPADVAGHPARRAFVRWGDDVGDWADWYDRERLASRFGEWFTVDRFTYIATWGQYAAARLRKRDTP